MPTLITKKEEHRASVNEAGAGTRCSQTLILHGGLAGSHRQHAALPFPVLPSKYAS